MLRSFSIKLRLIRMEPFLHRSSKYSWQITLLRIRLLKNAKRSLLNLIRTWMVQWDMMNILMFCCLQPIQLSETIASMGTKCHQARLIGQFQVKLLLWSPEFLKKKRNYVERDYRQKSIFSKLKHRRSRISSMISAEENLTSACLT